MVIDAHVHLIRPFDSRGNPQTYTGSNPSSAEAYGELMEQSGLDRAFFISWSPEDIPSDLSGKGVIAETARETMNRQYALEVMARYPERFYWFPCHLGPSLPNHMEQARENLETGAHGLKLVVSFWGELPDDPRPVAMCELAREFGAQIIIDTSFWYLGKDEPADPATLGEGHRQVAERVSDFQDYLSHLRALVTAFPTVNFQLAHAGARTASIEHGREVAEFMAQHRNVYAELGAVPTDHPMVDLLVEVAGADRVMFGTDWPHFAQGPAMRQSMEALRRPVRFRRGVAERILGLNAVEFVRGRGPGLRTGRGQ